MKVSIAAAILILLVAALFGIPKHQRLVIMRESHAKLVASAAQLGISVDLSRPDDPVRITKRNRENQEAAAKLAAAELIAFSKEMEAMGKTGGPPDETQQKRYTEMMERMMSLDPAKLKILITEIRATKDLKDETRQGLIYFSIMTLSNEHPPAALALFTETPELLDEGLIHTQTVLFTLTKWAKEDPLAALEWVKKNRTKFPDLITDDTKRGLIAGAAAQDPKLAFKLIGELEIQKVSQSIDNLMMAAKTPEQRTATLRALREHLATLTDADARTDLSNSAMSSFTYGLVQEGFEASTQWIAKSDFTPVELASFASGLTGFNMTDDHGKWLKWIGEKLPADQADHSICNLVSNWTREDYQAVGEWLTAAADGPTKTAAIQSYARTVARYEPANATQWALTLPPGQNRDDTLNNIYQNWPENDNAAKEAFKQEHGIE